MKKTAALVLFLSFFALPANAMISMLSTNGAPALMPPISDTIYDVALVSGTAQTITWPTGANYAILNGVSDYYVASNGNTAIVPSSSVTDGTGSALSPSQIYRGANTSFSIISSTSQIITISFYK